MAEPGADGEGGRAGLGQQLGGGAKHQLRAQDVHGQRGGAEDRSTDGQAEEAAALRALEWGHYFGLPAAVAHTLTGRWVLAPNRANLALTERLLRRYYDEPLPEKGAYLFFIARKAKSASGV